jgi:pyroglutamyl-peptidase
MRAPPNRAAPRRARILVTGFEPFDGAAANPSGAAARALHGSVVAGHRVHGLELPCVFDAAPRQLAEELDRVHPVLVLALGLAPSRSGFSLERVAINLSDARIPDNAGAQPLDRPVHAQGPAAHFTTLPVKAMLAALQAAAWPAELSHSAGTYVCNHVFYSLMQALTVRPGVRGGFMHVGADLSADAVAQGVRIALQAALAQPTDLALPGGAVD